MLSSAQSTIFSFTPRTATHAFVQRGLPWDFGPALCPFGVVCATTFGPPLRFLFGHRLDETSLALKRFKAGFDLIVMTSEGDPDKVRIWFGIYRLERSGVLCVIHSAPLQPERDCFRVSLDAMCAAFTKNTPAIFTTLTPVQLEGEQWVFPVLRLH